ncbi:MFS general substrate transporter [Xylariaceae sp. FL0594]|nr:MFS general substrate transporter [Xylariaceae sp. FL0594]
MTSTTDADVERLSDLEQGDHPRQSRGKGLTEDEMAAPLSESEEKPSQGMTTHPNSAESEESVETGYGAASDKEEGEDAPPDGGLTAWLQVVAALLTSMISWGTPTSFGVFQLYYVESLQLPQWQVSWIGSVQFLLSYIACVFSGRLADAGYVRETFSVGTFLVILGMFATSVGHAYWHIFLAQGVTMGLGLGIMFMPPLQVLSSYFQRRRTLAVTGAATGTGIGGVVLPAIVQYSIPRVGFGWAVRIVGFVALSCSVATLFLLKPRLKPRRSGAVVEWDAFKEPPYLFYSVGVFLLGLGLFFACFYINSFARNVIGFSSTDSVQLLLIQNGASIPARPIIGYVANYHVGPMNTYIVSAVILSVIMLSWIAVVDRTGLYVYAVFLGLTNGVCQGMYLGSLASLTTDNHKMGTRMGMVHGIVGFATLAGPPMAGAIIDRSNGRYVYGQIYAALTILLASGFFMAARYARTGPNLKVKV